VEKVTYLMGARKQKERDRDRYRVSDREERARIPIYPSKSTLQ
jgi:hypothetical protein